MCEHKTTTTIENFRDDIQIKTYYPEKLDDPISQGDIRYVDFGYYEDKGTKECGKQRPAIVFQIDKYNQTEDGYIAVIPLSSSPMYSCFIDELMGIKLFPDSHISVIGLNRMKFVDKSCIKNIICKCPKELMHDLQQYYARRFGIIAEDETLAYQKSDQEIGVPLLEGIKVEDSPISKIKVDDSKIIKNITPKVISMPTKEPVVLDTVDESANDSETEMNKAVKDAENLLSTYLGKIKLTSDTIRTKLSVTECKQLIFIADTLGADALINESKSNKKTATAAIKVARQRVRAFENNNLAKNIVIS